MTDSPPDDASLSDDSQARRPYSPGLEGVIAGETSLSSIDGERGRLLYRGYRIGDLVERGTYSAVANLLWTGDWDPGHRLPTAPVPEAVIAVLRALPAETKPMDALRTAVSAWGATQELPWPPTVDHARALTAFSPSALAAFARLRAGQEPVDPDPSLDLTAGLPLPAHRHEAGRGHREGPGRVLHRGRRARLQRLDVHGPGHHLDPLGPRVGGGRRDRHDEGPAPRRRAVRGRRPAQPGRLGRPRRGVGARSPRARRAADGLRASGVPGVRPAGRGPAHRRRGHGQQARLAPARDRGRGRRPAGPRREVPGPAAQDERRVLRRARAHGRRPHARPVPGHVLAGPRTPAGRRTRSSRRRTTD